MKAWKKAEQELASIFGTRRRPLSGLNHGTGRGDDAQHEKLYLECKHGKQCDKLFALFADTALKAANERHPNRSKVGRIPVVGIKAKGQKGMLLVIHSSDLRALLGYFAAAQVVKAAQKLYDSDGLRKPKLKPPRKRNRKPKPKFVDNKPWIQERYDPTN